ncbi:MAG: hypothetical protein ACQBVK_02840 [Candidatus Phytoplasma sp. TWB_XP]
MQIKLLIFKNCLKKAYQIVEQNKDLWEKLAFPLATNGRLERQDIENFLRDNAALIENLRNSSRALMQSTN